MAAERVPRAQLEAFIGRTFAALDVPKSDARIVAGLMAEADALGHDPVRIPGEGRGQRLADAAAQGIAIHTGLRRELDAIADELGVARV